MAKYKRCKNNDDYASWSGSQGTMQTLIGKSDKKPEYVIVTIGSYSDAKHDAVEKSILDFLNAQPAEAK